MNPPIDSIKPLLESLQERAKELSCLYRVDEILADADRSLDDVCHLLVDSLPPGWMYPDSCCARLTIGSSSGATSDFVETPWSLSASIVDGNQAIGELTIVYREERPLADEGPFLKEERKLIDTVAERISHFVTRQNLRQLHQRLSAALENETEERKRGEWGIVLEFLRSTDLPLLRGITRRMINHLWLLGIPEAERLLQTFTAGYSFTEPTDDNVPLRKTVMQDIAPLSEETFAIAARHLKEGTIVSSIRGWIEEERSGSLIEILEDQASALPEILEAIDRHRIHVGDTTHLPSAFLRSLGTALLRRLFSDEPAFIGVATRHVGLEDVYELTDNIIYPLRSHGKLGGKSAGLFLASEILRHATRSSEELPKIRYPKTWFISSDGSLEFLKHNNLRNLHSRKYMNIEHVRQEYPHIVQLLKNSNCPPEISRGLALALEDFGDRPLIVRSSSLLEDRMGASFAGKYKSLFLANRGDRKERLAALKDAVAEIYASAFSPDPIEYRAKRRLLDAHEEMGILIQEVVGRPLGPYFLPAFSGVAFSHNEYRWSARIRREDGLIRLVPGLGTRAVDRVNDDYPVLLAPGQPGLRVNVTADEVARYSPRWVDVINLETGSIETVSLRKLLREHGEDYPMIRQIVSISEEGRIRRPTGLEPNFATDELVATFDGLITDTGFVSQMNELLILLREAIASPVDIEFASDGTDLFLLQCRSQSHSEEFSPAPIPRNLARERMLFSAHRNIANGRVPDITHIVYVDPDRYLELADLKDLVAVGTAVGKLNKLLPKRQFVLIGPGRWGSRGDVRLGVRVSYADISNTALLMEIARQSGGFRPEPSFGTHFFQDLVEADIRYIPIYPDDSDGFLDELFLRRSRNLLSDLLPDYAHLAEAIFVVDVAREKDGRILRVLLNADLDEAVGIFDYPIEGEKETPFPPDGLSEMPAEAPWRWRMRMAERIAKELDLPRFGVKALYLFGSVKNATSGPGSDIDLLIHDNGPGIDREALTLWLDGWSKSLSEMNYLRTGYQSDGLLDTHFVTDSDIAKRTSFAVKIGAITDAARLLVDEATLSARQ